MEEQALGAVRAFFDVQNQNGRNADLKALKASGIDISANFALDKPEEELKGRSDRTGFWLLLPINKVCGIGKP